MFGFLVCLYSGHSDILHGQVQTIGEEWVKNKARDEVKATFCPPPQYLSRLNLN